MKVLPGTLCMFSGYFQCSRMPPKSAFPEESITDSPLLTLLSPNSFRKGACHLLPQPPLVSTRASACLVLDCTGISTLGNSRMQDLSQPTQHMCVPAPHPQQQWTHHGEAGKRVGVISYGVISHKAEDPDVSRHSEHAQVSFFSLLLLCLFPMASTMNYHKPGGLK